jgi:hypothetical protein
MGMGHLHSLNVISLSKQYTRKYVKSAGRLLRTHTVALRKIAVVNVIARIWCPSKNIPGQAKILKILFLSTNNEYDAVGLKTYELIDKTIKRTSKLHYTVLITIKINKMQLGLRTSKSYNKVIKRPFKSQETAPPCK